MKSPITTSVIITAATSLFCGVTQAQPGTASNVILSMTEYSEAPGTIAKDQTGKPIRNGESVYSNEWSKSDSNSKLLQSNYEYASKIEKYKISNRELLEAFKEEGVITDITGWSIKIVETAYDGESDTGPRFFLTKIGVPSVDVSRYFALEGSADAETAKRSEITTYKYNSEGAEISNVRIETGTSASRSSLQITIGEIDNSTLRLFAIADTTSKVTKLGNTYYDFFQGGKLGNISGGLTHTLDEGPPSVIDGTWTFSAPTVIPNLSSVYPIAVAE
jgi:hypothetical protein